MLTMMNNFYCWLNLKKEVAKFVARFLNYGKVKVESKHLASLLLPILIPEWKWEVISMDFVTGLNEDF